MDAAKDLLTRAVELDHAMRYSESLICYEEGIQNLLRTMKQSTASESGIKNLRSKTEQYLQRAEEIKKIVKSGGDPSGKVRYINISAGATGFGYDNVFKDCLDAGGIEWVAVQDPYIRARHQIHNFVRFCELLLLKCKTKLKKISLITGVGDVADQRTSLTELQENLNSNHSVILSIDYSSTLHDREIAFSNGWIVRIGRGLDYFQRSKGQFTIGFSEYNLRPCQETTIEIYHKMNMRKF